MAYEPRSFDSIIEKIKKHNAEFLDFTGEVLSDYLPPDRLAEAGYELKEGKTLADLPPAKPLEEAFIATEMKQYMEEYGWPKAENHRGISAGRSVQKMLAWLWLLGKEDVIEAVKGAPYANYGAPQLKVVAEAMGWPIPESPVLQAMMRGEMCPSCRAGYESGCGR